MNDLDLALLIDQASHEVADAIRPHLRELERENDRMLGEMKRMKRILAGIHDKDRKLALTERLLKEAQELAAEREGRLAKVLATPTVSVGTVSGTNGSASVVSLERFYTTTKRPAAHDHSTDEGNPPVVVLDMHGTLEPSRGFPMVEPFPEVKAVLDALAAQGCCLHIATAGLDPLHDPLVLAARYAATKAWVDAYSLPIGFITGKVGAHIFYDDRMVPVPDGGAWSNDIPTQIEAELAGRSVVGKNGVRTLVDLPERGKPIVDWPKPEDVPTDQPRGFSNPIVDVDIHRCLTESNSSQNRAAAMPGAVEGVTTLFAQGYTVHLSCAGWDPATHSPEESARRLAGLRQMVRQEGIPYDQIVSKDHGTVFVDDKGVVFRDWKKDLPGLLSAMAEPYPEDEITAMRGMVVSGP